MTTEWESIVSAGIEAQSRMDGGRWVIGDLALLVQKEYGQGSVEQFARDIKVELPSVRNYRTVSAFWSRENSLRSEILTTMPNLSWSHFRTAMQLKDMEAATDFLHEAAANDWSVEACRLELKRRAGKPEPPMKLLDTETTIADMRSGCRVVLELTADQYTRLLDAWRDGRTVRVAVWEVDHAAQPT